MEKLIIPWSFSYDSNGAVNERMIIKENEIIVITREHNNLLKGKYNMRRKSNHYTTSVGIKSVKDMACNIIADFFNMDRGVLLTFDDSLEDLAEETVKAIESGDYKKKVSKWITVDALCKDDIGEDIHIYVGKATDINCELKGMREKALKLPTAQNEEMLDEYIVVSPSQYNRIEAFARCNGYIIGEEAQKVLDHWKELQEKAIIIRANPCELSENNRL